MKLTYHLAAMGAVMGLSLSAFSSPVTAVLKLKEKVPVEQLAQEVRNPNSARFAKFYSPKEIAALSGPSQAEYDQLISQLKAQGFEVVKESPTRLWVSIKADSTLFDQVFKTQMLLVRGKGMKAFAVPQLPTEMPLVEKVLGLDKTRRSRPRLSVMAKDPQASPGGIAPATIKSAYGFNPIYAANIDGSGQDIAVATYNGFNISDVQYFYSYQKSNATVDQVTFNGTPAYDEDSSVETELDAEFSGMMAPGARVHVFASATNDDAGELAMFTAILDDNRAKVVNYSWGGCETELSSGHKDDMAKVFSRASAQGVNIMVASGDSGSDSCQNGGVVADWPAANPDVVAVGGTTFTGSASKVSEDAWNGSGGGISSLFDLPSWQQILGSPYVKRSYPDVAFNADPKSGQAVYAHSNGKVGWLTIGGTSMAAPQWSGFMALVGQGRQMAGKSNLGFLNPIIYSLSGDQQTGVFNDVKSGSNGAYNAGPGWDAVTGFGSMKADSLLQQLVAN